jgi:hypothetical protein
MLKKMFRQSFLCMTAFILVCSFGMAKTVEAASLYAILVGDTLDDSIGDHCQQDLYQMQAELQKISRYTGLKLNLLVFQGRLAMPQSIVQQVLELALTSDDVVILYFSMHGYRTQSKSDPWPNLYFSLVNQGLDFNAINQMVINKNPRLFISIADVCNNLIPDGVVPTLQPRHAALSQEASVLRKKNYTRLFLQSSGVILLSGAIPGQYSWSSAAGGVYTSAFLKTLKKEVEASKEASWYVIAEETMKKTLERTHDLEEPQTPLQFIQIQ